MNARKWPMWRKRQKNYVHHRGEWAQTYIDKAERDCDEDLFSFDDRDGDEDRTR